MYRRLNVNGLQNSSPQEEFLQREGKRGKKKNEGNSVPFLPAVGGEEQVDGSVVELGLGGQVGGDHVAHGRRAIGESPRLHGHASLRQERHQVRALRALAAAVQPFQHDQRPSLAAANGS